MARMQVEGTFTVVGFEPIAAGPENPIVTAMDYGVATIEKSFTGGVQGRSTALFTGGQDAARAAGSYVAFEAFDGSLDGRAGTFNFVHVASTHGTDRYNEAFFIVDSSGTGELAGISGGGALIIEADGTHRIRFDYAL